MKRERDRYSEESVRGDGLNIGLDIPYLPHRTVVQGTGDVRIDLRTFSPCSMDFVYVGEQTQTITEVLSWMYLIKTDGHLILKNVKRGNASDILDFIVRIPWVQIRQVWISELENSVEIVLQKMPVLVGKSTFKHSGARGDLIYALPAIRALGGGKVYINRKSANFFTIPVRDDELRGISEFLGTQTYIDSVEDFTDQTVDYNLDEFRILESEFIHLMMLPLIRFGGFFDVTKPWLDVSRIPAIPKAEIIISRTERYHAPFDWGELSKWTDRTAFVGTSEEREKFVRETGINVRWHRTESWMDLASVILGSKLFIGNQSMAYAMAEAMKHPRVLEVCGICPNCDPLGDNGHVRLNQGVIRKYVLGDPYNDVVRLSRPGMSFLSFRARNNRKRNYNDVSCVMVGKSFQTDEFIREFSDIGIEVLQEDGGTFEQAANEGIKRSTRQIICIIDMNSCLEIKTIAAVIESMMGNKTGMTATSICAIGGLHVSGPCFCVDRLAYEKAGLFNMAMRSGELTMLEMNMRYACLGIQCRSIGLLKWDGRISSEENDAWNRGFLKRNMGVNV